MALISVIVPIYNVEDYLEKCLKSLLSQTYSDLEIICVNDGSTDKSSHIVEKYKNLDERIVLIEKENSGAGASRNIGLHYAKGKYVWFVDGDDWVFENAFSCIAEFLKGKDDIDVLIFDAKSSSSEVIEKKKFLFWEREEGVVGNETGELNVLSITTPAPWNKIFKRSFLFQNEISFQSLKSCNDVAFVGVALFLANRVGILNKALYCYRSDAVGAISRKRSEYALNIFSAATHMKNRIKDTAKFNSTFFHDFISGCVAYEFFSSQGKARILIILKSISFFPISYLIIKILKKIKKELKNGN